MNYYKTETTYFIMFILMMAVSFSAMPFITNALSDYSDSYVRSQMKKIQGEMLFIDVKAGEYDRICYYGKTGLVINELVQERNNYVSCRTNKPQNTQALVCAGLKGGSYYCVDSAGVSCEVFNEPTEVYRCKNLAQLY